MTQRFRLDNGLTVLLEEQHAAKVAAFQVWVKAGSADERPDQAGLAHLHEHMLFKGTGRHAPGEIAREIEAHGGEINAWTSYDQTVYHVVMASQFARVGLDILADAVRAPAFDPGELAREIEVVCEEIKRSDDSPSRRASRDLFAAAYHVHPYLRPVTGWAETVRAFDRERVTEFYRHHYVPENMVLVAVGDLAEQDARRWAGELFGGEWGRRYAGRVERPPEPPPTGRRIALREDDVKEGHLHLAFRIPDVSHPDTPALDVLAMLAGQGEASRLVNEVKRRRGLVNDIGAYAYTPKDPGLWMVSMTAPASQAEAAVEASASALMQLCAEPAPLDELETVKRIFESETVYQRETVQGLARKLGFYEAAAGGIEAEARYYEQVAALSPEQIQAVAQRYLRLDRAIVTGLVPTGTPLTEDGTQRALDRAAKDVPTAAPVRRSVKAVPSPLRVTAAAAARRTSGIVVERLASGAQIIIREESAVPLVALRAVFQGGLRYETEGNNGLTRLLAKTLTRGTPSHDAEEIPRQVDEMAGAMGAAAGRNSVSLRGEFLSRHFRKAFDLFVDVLLHASFPEAELERERKLALQDVLTRDDKPSAVAFELFHRAVYHVHPYRLSGLGEQAPLQRLTTQDLRSYRERHMDPSQLTLSVVGDVRADDVLALASAAFGASGPGTVPPPDLASEPPLTEVRESRRTLPRSQSHLVLGGLGARLSDPWRYDLEVLSTVLSGQGGRLFVELRDKRSLAYSVSSFSSEGIEPGTFGVYIGTGAEKQEQALSGIREELDRVRQAKVSQKELERAQRHLVGTYEIGLQRNGARAAVLALDHAYGLGLDNFLHRAERILAVTAEDVLVAAQRVIDPARSALAVVGP
jgi:zinc protease